MKILLVEDEVAVSALTERIIKMEGHTCIATAYGESAILLIRQSAAAHEPFDLVISDFNLADSVKGNLVLEEAKIQGASSLAMSARPDNFDEFERMSPDRFLAKPFTVVGFRDVLAYFMTMRKVMAAAPPPSENM